MTENLGIGEGVKPEEVVYSSKDIMTDSVAGRNRRFLTNVKKTKTPLSARLRSLFKREKAKPVDTNGSPRKSKLNKKLIIILVIIIAAIIIATAIVLIATISSQKKNSELSQEDAEPENSLIEEAEEDETVTPEKVEEKRLAYEEQLEKAETKGDEAKIRSERAMYFWDLMAGRDGYDSYVEQILEDLKFAEDVEKTSETAYDLCMFLTNRESLNPENIDYCKIAKDRNPDAFTEAEADEWV